MVETPTISPPQSPKARQAQAVVPRGEGMAALSSASEKQRPTYMAHTSTVATSMPPVPPVTSPHCQPKKSPEMTAPTPIAQSCPIPAFWRGPCCPSGGAASLLIAVRWCGGSAVVT